MFARLERKLALNLLGGFLGAYGLTSFVCFMFIARYFEASAPHRAILARGLIYPHNEHGLVTYFSAFQATSCWLLFCTSIPLGAMGGYILPRCQKWVVRGDHLQVSSTVDWDDPQRVTRWGALAGLSFALLVVFVLAPPAIAWLNRIGFVANL
jgi:hypothetical protein